ncbi:hypothetical protein QVD99_002129 [Batrachochytrium dendrobatidis]|nr:hypothetical protein O5D80_005811 [Batrachochytrium dendrobatidis]KAK5671416.1 hypothetical protein QVD99_002129 [Batrachochytrium dendrobatidis]
MDTQPFASSTEASHDHSHNATIEHRSDSSERISTHDDSQHPSVEMRLSEQSDRSIHHSENKVIHALEATTISKHNHVKPETEVVQNNDHPKGHKENTNKDQTRHHNKNKKKPDDTPLRDYPDPLNQIEPPEIESHPKHQEELEQFTTTHQTKKNSGAFLYRHYTTFYPCANRLLAMKWDQTQRQQHLKKLSAVKPTIDNSPPKLHMHLQLKLKKVQMEEDRLMQIKRNNRILLEKMTHIMEMEAKDPSIHNDHDYTHSLSASFRARQMAKIAEENKAMLMRLETKQPHYAHTKWDKDRQRNLIYLQNISAYPQVFIDLQKAESKHQKGNDASKSEHPKHDGKGGWKESERNADLKAAFLPPSKQSNKKNKDQSDSKEQHGKKQGKKTTKTPVTDVDRIASAREPRAPVPLPDIHKDSDHYEAKESADVPLPTSTTEITAN